MTERIIINICLVLVLLGMFIAAFNLEGPKGLMTCDGDQCYMDGELMKEGE